jgi:hypothetical protein
MNKKENVILNNRFGLTDRNELDKVEYEFVVKRLVELRLRTIDTDKKKEASKEELEAIEYALLSCAMELNVSRELIDEVRENNLKVVRGEWTSQQYRDNILKKYKLNYKV